MEANVKITITLKESSNELQTQIHVSGVATPIQIAHALGKTLAHVVPEKKSKSVLALYFVFVDAYFEKWKEVNKEGES